MDDIKQLEKSILNFYNNSFDFKNITNSSIEIKTPFFDRRNDSLIIYVQKHSNNWRLTDGGYIIDDLENEGIYLSRSKKRMSLLIKQLNSFSIEYDRETNELFTITDMDKYPTMQNLLIQAMLFVNDMFLTSNHNVSNLFINEIGEFFTENNIRAIPDYNVISNTGMINHYDFSIAGNGSTISDKLIKGMNYPANNYAKIIATDVQLTRRKLTTRDTDFYIFVNDREMPIKDEIISLFDDQEIITVPYSEKKNFINKLAE